MQRDCENKRAQDGALHNTINRRSLQENERLEGTKGARQVIKLCVIYFDSSKLFEAMYEVLSEGKCHISLEYNTRRLSWPFACQVRVETFSLQVLSSLSSEKGWLIGSKLLYETLHWFFDVVHCSYQYISFLPGFKGAGSRSRKQTRHL